MAIRTEDYEKLGAFYLGREYDLEEKRVEEPLVLYDSKDLVTHGVVLGMTGSGKTGLCIALLEEAVMDNVPAIVIDPKGDIANLMLTFPEFRGEDFRPWVNEDDARKRGKTADEFAADQAAMWEEGLKEWGQPKARVQEFREKVDINVYTPGSSAGIPVSILSSLEVPPFEVVDDAELLGERIESTVSSLLALLGIEADPIQSREHILMSSIFANRWRAEESLTLATLIRDIQTPPFTQVGVMDLESFYKEDDRFALSMRLNNLLAAPGFSTWLEGEALDLQRMMYGDDGKPRVSIFSIAHLSESERMFFVSLLLNQTMGWMRGQSGTSSLRAILYMDEIAGYLPPTENPPSKKPMMTMLKQARAYGLGILLATQNPVDLDYKALSNTGTWFLGRLQTERDKAKVLEGLEGAAVTQGGAFDKNRMEQVLAGLGSRVFLMNNVHEDQPVVFHVRWVMSYLRGPLTRRQIKRLVEEKGRAPVEKKAEKGGAAGGKPSLPKGVEEYYVRATGGGDLVYVPAVLRAGEAVIKNEKKGVNGVKQAAFVNRFPDSGRVEWSEREVLEGGMKAVLRQAESDGASYRELPAGAIKAGAYKEFEDEFEEWFYREGGFELLHSPTFELYSKPGESEGDFRVRLRQAAREVRDEKVEALRDKYAKKIDSLEKKVEKAMIKVEKEEAQAKSAKLDTAMSIGSAIFGALLGRKKMSMGTISRGRTAARGASRAWKESRDIEYAKEAAEELEEDLRELEEECQEAVDELKEQYDPANEKLETVEVTPYKKDISVKAVGLVWLPFRKVGEGEVERAY